MTLAAGPTAPVYVHGLFAVTESELAFKEGNLRFSTLSTVVVPIDVEDEVVDKTHWGQEEKGSLGFAETRPVKYSQIASK